MKGNNMPSIWRKGSHFGVWMIVVTLIVGCGGGSSGPETKSIDDLLKHFEANNVGVGMGADKKYGPAWRGVKGKAVSLDFSKVIIYKFNLAKEKHKKELQRLEEAGEIAMSRHAPGLKEPVRVNGPFLIHPITGSSVSNELSRIFMDFDPYPEEVPE